MSKNPNPNSVATTNQTTNSPDAWSSPKGTAAKNFVKFDNDDQHPERVERLGQYLSDTTRGDMSNTDVRGGQSNEFPVSPPGETTPTYGNRLETVIHKAVDYFNELSDQAAFYPGVGEQQGGGYGSGHDLSLIHI